MRRRSSSGTGRKDETQLNMRVNWKERRNDRRINESELEVNPQLSLPSWSDPLDSFFHSFTRFHNSISWTGTPLWPLSIYLILIHSMKKKKKKIFPELSRRVKKRGKERLSKMHRIRYYIPSEPSFTPLPILYGFVAELIRLFIQRL